MAAAVAKQPDYEYSSTPQDQYDYSEKPSLLSRIGTQFADIPRTMAQNMNVENLLSIPERLGEEGSRIKERFGSALSEFGKGNIGTGISTAMEGVPILGPASRQAADYLHGGEFGKAAGTLAPLLLSPDSEGVADSARLGAESPGVRALGPSAMRDAASALADTTPMRVAGGALKGAGKAMVTPIDISRHGMKMPIPAPLAGAAVGGMAGFSHIPYAGEVGAITGASLPIIRGAIEGGRSALQEARGLPENIPGPAEPFRTNPVIARRMAFGGTTEANTARGFGKPITGINRAVGRGPDLTPSTSTSEPGVLDQIAIGQGLRSFSAATANQQETIRNIADRLNEKPQLSVQPEAFRRTRPEAKPLTEPEAQNRQGVVNRAAVELQKQGFSSADLDTPKGRAAAFDVADRMSNRAIGRGSYKASTDTLEGIRTTMQQWERLNRSLKP